MDETQVGAAKLKWEPPLNTAFIMSCLASLLRLPQIILPVLLVMACFFHAAVLFFSDERRPSDDTIASKDPACVFIPQQTRKQSCLVKDSLIERLYTTFLIYTRIYLNAVFLCLYVLILHAIVLEMPFLGRSKDGVRKPFVFFGEEDVYMFACAFVVGFAILLVLAILLDDGGLVLEVQDDRRIAMTSGIVMAVAMVLVVKAVFAV